MIEVKELTKYYGDKLAVAHLSFTIKEGEILGFLGPNGAGKSTTMNILTGYLSATSGEVTIAGINLFENPGEAKKCIGYLPEIPPVYIDMTVEEYLKFMCRLKKIPSSFNEKKHIEDICAQVNITHVKKRLIKHLSKGYRQRVGIAQAMIGDPKILILDEPTVGLDPNQILEIRQLIQKLGRKHTVILSSHILQEIQAVCSRILIINEGKLVADEQVAHGKTVSVKNMYQLLIEGPEEAVTSALLALPGVKTVKAENRYETEVYGYTLQAEGETPMRRAIFDCVAGNGWRLLGLECREQNLEDFFIRLTAGGYSGYMNKKEAEAAR